MGGVAATNKQFTPSLLLLSPYFILFTFILYRLAASFPDKLFYSLLFPSKPGWRRRYSLRLVLLIILASARVPDIMAQVDTVSSEKNKEKPEGLFSVGLGIQHGFIFPHSQEVQNTKGARPTGLETTLSWQSNDAPTWELCNCFPRKGLLLNYYDFDRAILGKGISAAYFLEPTYRITNTIFFSFKGAAGVSYLTNPFDSVRNPTNQSYSTTISAYLSFGVGAWFRLNDRWWLNPSGNYQHISNGGMKKPNKGINWPTAGLAISYQPRFRPYYTGIRSKEKIWQNYAARWDIGALGTAKRGSDENGNRIRFPLIGLSLQAAKQVGRLSNVTLGAEIYQDEELRNELNQSMIKASPVKAGMMAGHEFILGKFLFSQRLGYYIFNQEPQSDTLFHRWGLYYRINRHFGAGFNLLAHRQVAEFIDLRIAYSVQKKYR